jgi:DNA-binding HxlR family transcriptional regulator
MALPKPGKPVRGSQTGRPIMALLDLLGRRWVLRIIWEMRDSTDSRESALTFRDLRERCDTMSPTVLNQRLHELRETGIVELAQSGGYILSQSGRQLHEAMGPLLRWSEDWNKRLLQPIDD